MKNWGWILIVIGILIMALFFVRFILGGSEDSWIKDEEGIYVKHGFPSETPDSVVEQQTAILCAFDLYEQRKLEGMEFSSQCLGTCNNYAVDVVNVPRTAEDDKPENQCSEYREGKVSKFIELDKNGNIVRIV